MTLTDESQPHQQADIKEREVMITEKVLLQHFQGPLAAVFNLFQQGVGGMCEKRFLFDM